MSGEHGGDQAGERASAEAIPLGMTIHNIELRRGAGGRLVRSAGTVRRS